MSPITPQSSPNFFGVLPTVGFHHTSSLVVIPVRDHRVCKYVIQRIESLIETLFDALVKDKVLVLPYRNRRSATVTPSMPPYDSLRFPGRTPAESIRFAGLLKILEMSHKALLAGTVITKRNIYYQNKELFAPDQRVVDNMIDNLVFTLGPGIGREDLNIVATAKGLISGPVELIMRDKTKFDAELTQDGVQLPSIRTVEMCDFRSTSWLLVVKKDATFRTLAHTRYHSTSRAGPGILVTGKGMPDLETRAFLNAIHAARPQLAMYALVDFDPDGVAIMRTYKYGSRQLLHERNLTVPGLKWLGVMSDDILIAQGSIPDARDSQDFVATGFTNSSLSSAHWFRLERPSKRRKAPNRSTIPYESVQELTNMDRKKAVDMLRDICSQMRLRDGEKQQKYELQRILVLGVKAEMQAVDNLGSITDWLDKKLCMS